MGRMGILSIYCSGDAHPANGLWSVDVYQDRIHELRHVSWTWTVVSKKQLLADGEDETKQPEWVIVVDAPFSYDIVRAAVEKWLYAKGYRFRVRMAQQPGGPTPKRIEENVEPSSALKASKKSRKDGFFLP
jgi:hypothetical protein